MFLPIFREHREYFYDWCDIGSIYGAPLDCIWSGGRVENGEVKPWKVLELMQDYGISARLTFSNSLFEVLLTSSFVVPLASIPGNIMQIVTGAIIAIPIILVSRVGMAKVKRSMEA